MGNESLLEVEGTRVARRNITCAQDQNGRCAGNAHLTRGGHSGGKQLALRRMLGAC